MPVRRPRALPLAARIVLVALLLGLAPWFAAPAHAAPMNTMEQEFVTKINAERKSRGLPALQADSRLADTARSWAAYMDSTNDLAHDPDLVSDATAVDPKWTRVGENVGYGYSVQGLHDSFMNSPGHRANVLHTEYNRVGVGVSVESSGRIWVTVRFLKATALTSTSTATSNPPSTRAALVADFTGDGKDDVFVYGPGTSRDQFLVAAGTGAFTSRSVTVDGYYRPAAGDFDGDGRAEILWYGVGSAPDRVSEWNGTSWTATSLSVGGDYRPVAGDFDGDGNDDVAWYGLGGRGDALWFGNSAPGSFTGASLSITGVYRVAAGDLDGDGKDDLLLYGPGSAGDKVLYGRASRSWTYSSIGAGGDYRPAIGDLDGDQIDDIVWYGPGDDGDAIWYMRSTRNRFTRVGRSAGGDHLPAVGDTNGDGAEDIVWFSPSSAVGDTLWLGVVGALKTTSDTVGV